MKYKRASMDYAGGSGGTEYVSELFSVSHFAGRDGEWTHLRIHAWDYARVIFDGHVSITSDEECIEQLTPAEILRILEAACEAACKQGANNKVDEFKAVLGYC